MACSLKSGFSFSGFELDEITSNSKGVSVFSSSVSMRQSREENSRPFPIFASDFIGKPISVSTQKDSRDWRVNSPTQFSVHTIPTYPPWPDLRPDLRMGFSHPILILFSFNKTPSPILHLFPINLLLSLVDLQELDLSLDLIHLRTTLVHLKIVVRLKTRPALSSSAQAIIQVSYWCPQFSQELTTSHGSVASPWLLLPRTKQPSSTVLFLVRLLAQASICVSRAMRWWEKTLKPNMIEIHSAQQLVDSLASAGDRLVIIDFYSPGCGGCRTLHPKICQLAELNSNSIFLKVNYEELKPMCHALHIHVLPFFRFYRGADGRVCSFSCTNATIKKFKDALTKHGNDRCSLGPAKGLDESELLKLATIGEITINSPLPSAIMKERMEDLVMGNIDFSDVWNNPDNKKEEFAV